MSGGRGSIQLALRVGLVGELLQEGLRPEPEFGIAHVVQVAGVVPVEHVEFLEGLAPPAVEQHPNRQQARPHVLVRGGRDQVQLFEVGRAVVPAQCADLLRERQAQFRPALAIAELVALSNGGMVQLVTSYSSGASFADKRLETYLATIFAELKRRRGDDRSAQRRERVLLRGGARSSASFQKRGLLRTSQAFT